MTALSNYAEDAALDHVLSTSAWSVPTDSYLKLHIGDPGEDCTANPSSETTRVITSWAAAASGSITTNANATWASLSLSGDETFSHFSLWDALTAGNPLAYGALSAPLDLQNGDEFRIDSGDLTLSFAGTMLTTYAMNALLDHLTGRSAWTMPAGSFVKLHTGAPGASAASNPATETTRVSATFGASSGGSASNSGAVTWSGVAATENVSHISVWDALTVGNPLLIGALGSTKSLTSGQDARFASGTLTAALT